MEGELRGNPNGGTGYLLMSRVCAQPTLWGLVSISTLPRAWTMLLNEHCVFTVIMQGL